VRVTRKHGQHWTALFAWMASGVIAAGLFCGQGYAQTATPQPLLPQFIQQAQTVHIPINVFSLSNISLVKDLKASDITLDVDGKPQSFQLSRPWDQTVSPKTGENFLNLLIILPFDGPQYRVDAINDAIASLKAKPELGWNISILDDGGDQTPYTRDMTTVISELERIRSENPADTDLDSWRLTASLAIANMRDLPGRRVVMSLGDIFHEVVFDGTTVVYENFEAHDVAFAARSAGAVIYAADSFQEIGPLRGLFPFYYTLGFGPWMLLTRDNHLEGWISNFAADTLSEIQQDGMSAYDIDIHLDLKQMDGQAHAVSVTPGRRGMIVNAPSYYIAPDLAQLQELAKGSPALRKALDIPLSDPSAPLQLATQMEYFPHPDGKTGTQLISTGLFWTKDTPPPPHLEMAQQLRQTSIGYTLTTVVGRLAWTSPEPVWNTAVDVAPGAYRLNVAAADEAGKITAGVSTAFTVVPTNPHETVRISSLVVGKSCVFSPEQPSIAGKPRPVDYLRAGNCDVQLNPSHFFSPQDIVWTLIRITPVGKFAGRPSKDWQGSFLLFDEAGSKLAEEPIHWLTAEDGSFVATTAFQLGDPKLKLKNGKYAVVLTLKGPGIEHNYGEDAPFLVYGADAAASNAPAPDQRGKK